MEQEGCMCVCERNLTNEIYSMQVITIRTNNKEQTLLPGDHKCFGRFQAA